MPTTKLSANFAHFIEDEADLEYIVSRHENDARDDAGEPLDTVAFIAFHDDDAPRNHRH